jgi:hypothetical protein
MNFVFKIGQKVKVRSTGEVGVVKERGTEPTLGLAYYEVDLDGTVQKFPERDLWPE